MEGKKLKANDEQLNLDEDVRLSSATHEDVKWKTNRYFGKTTASKWRTSLNHIGKNYLQYTQDRI